MLIALDGWRLTFAINVPLAAVGAVFALAWLPRDEPHRPSRRDLDLPGVALFSATLSALLVFTAIVFWAWLWGPIGAFLAVPMSIVALVIFNHLFPTEDGKLPG